MLQAAGARDEEEHWPFPGSLFTSVCMYVPVPQQQRVVVAVRTVVHRACNGLACVRTTRACLDAHRTEHHTPVPIALIKRRATRASALSRRIGEPSVVASPSMESHHRLRVPRVRSVRAGSQRCGRPRQSRCCG